MSDFWKDYEPEPTRPAPVTKDEVLKLALEALTVLLDEWTPARQAQLKGMEAVTAIKQALAAPVQEPVAHMNQNGVIHEAGYSWGPSNHLTPLYPHPAPVQEPVARIAELEETVRQLNHALREATETPTFMGEPVISEPVAKIKGVDEYGPMLDWFKHWINFPVGTKLYTTPPAQPSPVQEPVGEVCGYYERGFDAEKTRYGKLYNQDLPLGIKLYTTPPAAQRQWVGLTDEEREQHRDDWRSNIHDKEFRAIEAKLKEKNT